MRAYARFTHLSTLFGHLPCQVAPCNFTATGCLAGSCYDYSRQGYNGAAFTVGADSNGANGFIGDIYESFRFQLNDPTVLWSVMSNLILPYLQVSDVFRSVAIPTSNLHASFLLPQAKYYVNCPSAINPSANASTPLGVAICSGPAAEGESCTTGCVGGFGLPVFGTATVSCLAGRWMGGTGGYSGPLVCARSCPAVPPPANAASCSLVQVGGGSRMPV